MPDEGTYCSELVGRSGVTTENASKRERTTRKKDGFSQNKAAKLMKVKDELLKKPRNGSFRKRLMSVARLSGDAVIWSLKKIEWQAD